MKTKLLILVTFLSIVFSTASASVQQPGGINPTSGLPEPATNIDPATGLPADGSPPFKDTSGVPTWIDPDWTGPDQILPSVQFANVPVTEVVRLLQEKFGDRFDVIFPATSGDVDPTQINVDLQLKNVTASEIFSAMNLQFELGKSPYRWELTLNGSRQVALLRYLPQLGPPPAPAPVPVRKVFFVGDMLGDFPGTNDVQKLHGLSDEVFNVWDQTKMRGGDVEIYPPGQSLIVSGTPGAVDLAEQTLRALKEKAVYESSHPQPQRVKSE